jgi:hypothetical protein
MNQAHKAIDDAIRDAEPELQRQCRDLLYPVADALNTVDLPVDVYVNIAAGTSECHEHGTHTAIMQVQLTILPVTEESERMREQAESMAKGVMVNMMLKHMDKFN